jgi:hypothetical protein
VVTPARYLLGQAIRLRAYDQPARYGKGIAGLSRRQLKLDKRQLLRPGVVDPPVDAESEEVGPVSIQRESQLKG